MHGKISLFHLTAHSNALAASLWVLELILPQIYLVLFRSSPWSLSTPHFFFLFLEIWLLFYISCCVEKWQDIEGKLITLDGRQNAFNCFLIWLLLFSKEFSKGLLAFANLALGNKFVSIDMHPISSGRCSWTNIAAVTDSRSSILFYTDKN